MKVLQSLRKAAWITCLLPLTLLSLYAEPLPATISLPSVQWGPGQPEFSLNDSLTLDFTSDEPLETLEARVFEGTQANLIAQARSAPAGICRPFSSFKLHVTSTAGIVTFNFKFYPYSIYDHNNDAVHDKYYTIVIEKPRGPLQFKLSADQAEQYFQSGKQIKVRAPAHPAEAIQLGREAYNQERDAARANPIAAGGAHLFSVAEGPESRTACVIILTNQSPLAAAKPCSDFLAAHTTETLPPG
jgi:hypothetical protein